MAQSRIIGYKYAVIPKTHNDDLSLLIDILPPQMRSVFAETMYEELLEVVMDLGRRPQARFPDRAMNITENTVTQADLDHVVALVGEFDADNRAGLQGTLHRISALRNRKSEIIGLTLRAGRAVYGTIDLIKDLVEDGASLLLLGRPGSGKTTKLREVARVLADDFNKRVIVIDTSNEIGGDGDIPHPAIGDARRMQVPHPEDQHALMIEAVQNHMPEVIIVDEIGTAAEAAAARTIAERGVQLIGTAHGNSLDNLLLNPTLSDLVGGVHTVTLGDEEARLRGTQKTITERRLPPTFDRVVEILDRDEVKVHVNTARSVDTMLRDEPIDAEIRRRTTTGEILRHTAASPGPTTPVPLSLDAPTMGLVRIYPYCISRDSIERVIRDLRIDARTVPRPEQADVILALRARADDPRLRRIVELRPMPVHMVKKNTTAQLRRTLQDVFHQIGGQDESQVEAAVRETESAVRKVLNNGVSVELRPQSSGVRQLQQRIVARHHLVGESVGREPRRHLVIRPR